jgi:hypothetical protein
MEVRERSGLGVFVAEPGGGKSTLIGALGYLNGRRGVQVTLLDPSGPLARLCQMPELRPYSRVLNLTGSEQGHAGAVLADPDAGAVGVSTGAGGDREFEIAVSNARAERRMLGAGHLLDAGAAAGGQEASTATLLRHAVRQVPAEETSTLDDVVRPLQGLDDDEARNWPTCSWTPPRCRWRCCSSARRRPSARQSSGADRHHHGRPAAADMKIEREYWSAEESLALPMLHTAHRLAVRRCYGGSMSSAEDGRPGRGALHGGLAAPAGRSWSGWPRLP